MQFFCNYDDDLTEISKGLSFRDYGAIMTEAVIYAVELSLFLPVAFENVISNELTPWIRAGITDFSICHIFDVELNNDCPSYTKNNDNGYIAIGTFEIAAKQNLNKYKSKLFNILRSNDFLDSFTDQMNIKLGNLTGRRRRRLSSYNEFEALQIEVIDPFGTTTTTTTTTTTPAPTTNITIGPSMNDAVVVDPDKGDIHGFSSGAIVVIVILILIMVIMCIGFGWLYKYKTNKSQTIIEIQREVEGARVEMKQFKAIKSVSQGKSISEAIDQEDHKEDVNLAVMGDQQNDNAASIPGSMANGVPPLDTAGNDGEVGSDLAKLNNYKDSSSSDEPNNNQWAAFGDDNPFDDEELYRDQDLDVVQDINKGGNNSNNNNNALDLFAQ